MTICEPKTVKTLVVLMSKAAVPCKQLAWQQLGVGKLYPEAMLVMQDDIHGDHHRDEGTGRGDGCRGAAPAPCGLPAPQWPVGS